MRPITITIGGSKTYLQELQARLEKHDVKAAELAREAELDRSQISRWFSSPDGNITLSNIERLERALATILRKRGRAKRVPPPSAQAGIDF